jgi:hypothetical protein
MLDGRGELPSIHGALARRGQVPWQLWLSDIRVVVVDLPPPRA